MKKIVLMLTLLFSLAAYTQQSIQLTPDDEIVMVTDLPANRLPKGGNLYFYHNYETMVLYALTPQLKGDSNTYDVIGEFKAEDVFLNSAKSEAYFTNDTIFIWTQFPFKALESTYSFLWNGKALRLLSMESRDPSWEAVERAEAALAKGDIKQAIDEYNRVMYPMSYMNENIVGMEILSAASKFGTKAFKEKDYKKACALMQTALDYYYFNDAYMNYSSREELVKDLQDHYLEKYEDSLGLWLGNYGYFLYKADSLQKSITVNAYINMIYPELSGPFLQKADALYETGDTKGAKIAYLRYAALMKEKGKEKSIPERVKLRTE